MHKGGCNCDRTRYICHSCQATINIKDVLTCSRCYRATYCSKECQQKDWKNLHPRYCMQKKFTIPDYIECMSKDCYIIDCHAHGKHPMRHKMQKWALDLVLTTELRSASQVSWIKKITCGCGKRITNETVTFCAKLQDQYYGLFYSCNNSKRCSKFSIVPQIVLMPISKDVPVHERRAFLMMPGLYIQKRQKNPTKMVIININTTVLQTGNVDANLIYPDEEFEEEKHTDLYICNIKIVLQQLKTGLKYDEKTDTFK